MDADSDEDQPPEWVAHKEYIRTLRSSNNPLSQILSNIEEIDGTVCALGQHLEDKHMFSLEMFDALEDDTADFLAVATRSFLEQLANSCLPPLIGHLCNVRHMLAYAREQVQAFPTLVDCQDFLCSPNVAFRVSDPPAGGSIPIPRNVGATVAPSPEEVQGVSTATEYLQALRCSTNPFSQLLATIEDSDVVLCVVGQLLLDAHKGISDWNRTLADYDRPLAGAIIHLFEPLVHEGFPTLIVNTHTAHHVITHVRRQVRAYPDLVDRRAVPRTTLVDFQVCDPPVNVRTHTL